MDRPRHVCGVSELPAKGAATFDVGGRELIVVRTVHGEGEAARADAEFLVYENRCPHRGTSLDWAPGRVMSPDGAYLQCATHGALFELNTGLCVEGPCQGESLAPVEVELGPTDLRLKRS